MTHCRNPILLCSLGVLIMMLAGCSPMYSAAARSALMRGSYEDAEKFLVLGDFSEEEKDRLLTAWCQEQYPDGVMPHGAELAQLESCFPSGQSNFSENLAQANQPATP